ncbi:MAG: hypothetical protein N2652_05505 [Kiritimatiellae bacterium]|nr:hypothetical protein [Kiritimatiellia bacterium]
MSAGGRCPACGHETLWIRTPRYEGFRRVGEEFKCARCGARVAAEAAASPAPRQPAIFSEEDRPVAPRVFAGEPPPRFCRRCRHYVVNPFRQWCGLHRRDVAATDSCDQFEARESAELPDG